jgi:NADH dehydrogenase FAD-containing subunit
VESVTFCDIESFTFDENRRAIIKKVEGSEHTIECDTVIFATGQRTDLAEDSGLERGRGNCIATAPGSLNTSVAGIFACGDAIYGTKSVVQAIASGREAAEVIDKYLGGDGDISEVLCPEEAPSQYIGKIPGFADQKRAEEDFLAPEARKDSFTPISGGICDGSICGEAGRCLQCDLRFGITGHRLWSDYTADADTQ